MRTITFIALAMLLFSCKTVQRPKMDSPLDEAAIKTINEGTYYVYSTPLEKQEPLAFPLLPKEYQDEALPLSRFKLQIKADSVYVSYQKVKDSTTVTMRKGFSGKLKKNCWRHYNKFRVYPFIPFFIATDIDRVRIAADKEGNLLLEVYRDFQGAAMLFVQFYNTFVDTFVFKREDNIQ